VLNKQVRLRIKKHKLQRIACRDREYRENNRSLKDLITMTRWRTANWAVKELLRFAASVRKSKPAEEGGADAKSGPKVP
jgi:hypothetical protein